MSGFAAEKPKRASLWTLPEKVSLRVCCEPNGHTSDGEDLGTVRNEERGTVKLEPARQRPYWSILDDLFIRCAPVGLRWGHRP